MSSRLNGTSKSGRGRPPIDSEAINIRVATRFIERIDNWRRHQSDLPSRPEAIRRLVEQALSKAEKSGD